MYQDILDALKSMGRLKAQGYFYGYPEDAEGVRARLRSAGKLNPLAPVISAQPDENESMVRAARP